MIVLGLSLAGCGGSGLPLFEETYNTALHAYGKGRYEDAHTGATKTINLLEDSNVLDERRDDFVRFALWVRADAFFRLEQWGRASADYGAILALEPNNKEAQRFLRLSRLLRDASLPQNNP